MRSYRFLYLQILLAGISLLPAAAPVFAHSMEAKITVISPARVVVEGKFLEERFSEEKNWTFLQSYADVGELGKRIFKFELFDAQGGDVGYKKFAPGIYTAKGPAAKWRYEIDLRPAEAPTAAAHVSWLLPDGGLLMPEDLLPRLTLAAGEKASAKVSVELPEGWKAWSADRREGENEFEIDDVSRSVLAVGKNWRESTGQQGSTELSF